METSAAPPSKNRWYRVAAWSAGALLALAVLAAVSWPNLLESTARKKVVSTLERKFDVVELGCFELGRDQLHICDIHLEKESVVVDLAEMDISFDIRWLERQVVVASITSRGGTLAGDLEDIKELRSSSSSSEGAGPGRLVLEDAELGLENLELDVRRGRFELKTVASASSSGTAGPVALELVELELLEEAEVIASASTVTTELSLEEMFPLEAVLAGGSLRHQDLVVEDVSGTITLEDEALERGHVDLHGQIEEGQSWTLKGFLDRKEEYVVVDLSAQDLRPRQLPGAHQLPVRPDEGVVSGNLYIKGSRKKLRLEGELRLEKVVVEHQRLARDPVVISNLFEGAGTIDLGRRELKLEKASIKPLEEAGWHMDISGRYLHAQDPKERELALEMEMPTAECQRLLEGVPPGLLPALEGFELSGVTYAYLKVFVKMNDHEATVLEGGLDLDACKLEKVPKTVASLTGPFSHVVKMRTGRTVSRLLGRGALYYTPYDRMPKHLPAAVLSTEDGGFWRHDGFLDSQFKASLKRNIELGKFRRGASTITMQMVKNVLLTQEKTVSRKLQELFLTWVVEEKLGKQRIMEIYLNVVEFGPGIYGVGDAADHYFGKTPLELTSLESAFLATLLPRPVERHEMWCRGELTEKHAKYIHRVHRRMLATHRITQAEFDGAEAEGFVFSRRGWAGEAACLAEGRRVAEGTHTQGALSGLLLGRPD
jgi:hypothetical protein